MRLVPALVLAIGLALPAAGQQLPKGPMLSGEGKLKFVVQQLDLNEGQNAQVETLLSVYRAEIDDAKENLTQIMDQIRAKYAELKDAAESKDDAKIKRLKEELRQLSPGYKPEQHFFDGLAAVLTDAQKPRLRIVLRQIDPAGETTLKPVHVIKAARSTKLTAEQEKQLEEILRDFRAKVSGVRGDNDAVAGQLITELIRGIRKVLTAEQAAEYDKALAAAGTEEERPATQPAEPAPPAPAATEPATPAGDAKPKSE